MRRPAWLPAAVLIAVAIGSAVAWALFRVVAGGA